jgi:predicted PurR-regulated permease PerM
MLRKIEISHKTVIFTVLFLLFLGFVYFIRDIILQFFVAVLIMTILNPLVAKLSKIKVPRVLSVTVVYVLVLGLFSLTLAWIIPPLIDQTTSFANNLPQYLTSLGISQYLNDQITNQLFSQLGSLPTQLVKLGSALVSNILSIFVVLIFVFYLLLAREKLDDQLGFLFDEERKKAIGRAIDRLEMKLGGWARGQLILMLIIGVVTYVGLLVLGIPFALPLAILAGLLEIIPIIGPIISATPAVIIALTISPIMALATAAMIFLIHQLENYILLPKVMEKSAGVNPIIVLLALAIGFRVAGIVGATLSVPVVLTIQVLFQEYLFSSKGE